MNKLQEYLPLIEKELERSVAHFPDEMEVNELYEPIQYILSIGGKRLRPALVLMGAEIFNKDLSLALQPAVALEVFHNFTLLHDDIMDKASMRRGKDTVHTKWNENIAILSGDAMMIKAYDYFSELPPEIFKKVFNVFNRVALEVCIGQQYDMNFELRNDVSVDEYLEMIKLKTSVLIAGALKIGGIIGGGSPTAVDALYEYGLNLGLSFQMQDDILDVYADQDVFGKTIGGDIVANKKTYMLIKAMELAEGDIKDKLEYWLQQTDFDRNEKVNAIKEIYAELKIRELTEQKKEEYYLKALQAIDKIEDKNDNLYLLREFAQWLMQRKK